MTEDSASWLPTPIAQAIRSTGISSNKNSEDRERKQTKQKRRYSPKRKIQPLSPVHHDEQGDIETPLRTHSVRSRSRRESNKDDKDGWLPTPQKLIIENRNTNDDSCLSGMVNMKGVIGILICVVVASTFLFGFDVNPFKFGREGQIAQLQKQVFLLDQENAKLQSIVDKLEDQVILLSNETDRLELINADLIQTTSDLTNTVESLSNVNSELEQAMSNQEDISDGLETAVTGAIAVNDNLVASILTLESRIGTLTKVNGDLQSSARDLDTRKDFYSGIVGDIHSSNVELSLQINELEEQLEEAEKQNNELVSNNEELFSIITFLNQAGIDLGTSVSNVQDYLVEEIQENTVLVLYDLKMYYQNIYFYWTCATSFEDRFQEKDWMLNKNTAIGESDYSTVLEFVDVNVFQKICVNKADFERFLSEDDFIGYQGSFPPVQVSVNTLISSVERYSTKLIEFYFPPEGSTGLTQTDWNNAMYDCANIPTSKRYVWSQD